MSTVLVSDAEGGGGGQGEARAIGARTAAQGALNRVDLALI